MSELASAMRLMGRLPTAILRYPTGRFGLVGRVPGELTEPAGSWSFPEVRRSKIWDTEQEAIDALIAVGVRRFQLSDCSWYEEIDR